MNLELMKCHSSAYTFTQHIPFPSALKSTKENPCDPRLLEIFEEATNTILVIDVIHFRSNLYLVDIVMYHCGLVII